ncbi:uncharacterized protein LOC132729987 [Ruditapes philippinarum]|uniref:uncharacterized protein LOC132729987 n=1 Tax=Ruditapes philippinarum TaxID=129788 RepID=UPI00295AF2DC|nr:uncharacterized protein LOC132729987 [Ruditapes philippinarum]
MMITTVCFLLFSMCIALGAGECPLEACTLDLKPPGCRAVSFFVHNGEVCQSCDMCVRKTNNLIDGCPLRPCNRMYIPKRCRREMYFVYQGGKICQDCPRNICKY